MKLLTSAIKVVVAVFAIGTFFLLSEHPNASELVWETTKTILLLIFQAFAVIFVWEVFLRDSLFSWEHAGFTVTNVSEAGENGTARTPVYTEDKVEANK